MSQSRSWAELVGDLILVRVSGPAEEQVILDCQKSAVQLLKDTNCRRILYDALEMENPTIDVALLQQRLSEQFAEFAGLRVAVLVTNTRTAYLGRLAFGSAEHRVFYNDMAAAVDWLKGEDSP
jgi:hypothetical protein